MHGRGPVARPSAGRRCARRRTRSLGPSDCSGECRPRPIDSASSSSCSAASASLSPIRSARPLPKLRRRTSARISCPRNSATARAGFARAGTSGASTTCAPNSIQLSRWATRSWRRPKRTATPIMRCRRAMRCGRRVCSAAIWRRLVTMWTARWPSTRSTGMERRR